MMGVMLEQSIVRLKQNTCQCWIGAHLLNVILHLQLFSLLNLLIKEQISKPVG